MSRKSYPNVNAANQYARDVVRGKIVACQYVIDACQRHIDDMAQEKGRKFRYRFDKDLAEQAAKFIQLLPHTKGEWAFKRMPITLEPWQLFIVCCAFGWVQKGTKLRRFREVYTEIPRKNGKSAISAGVALYCFTCDNEFGAEVYSGATTEKQAWEVFRPAKLMCKRTPLLTEAFGIEVNAKNMNRPEDGARFEPLIGDPGDGQSPHCAIVDEYHEHDTDSLYTTMLTGMGARRQPLMWAITTAGYNIEGPCYDKRREVIEMLNGTVPNDELFGVIYTVDDGDDWTDPNTLKKANPNMGISVYSDFLISQQNRAKNNPRLASIFKTKHLNIWVSARSAYFNMLSWRECEDKTLTLEMFEGQSCVQSLDLARKLDMNSRVPDIQPGEQLQQQRKEVFQRVTQDGSWNRETDQSINEASMLRTIKADKEQRELVARETTVQASDTLTVLGTRKLLAGAIQQLSEGDYSIATSSNYVASIEKDMTLDVGQNSTTTVGQKLIEKVGQIKQSIAGAQQQIIAPVVWIGSQQINVAQLMIDTLDVVKELAELTAAHTHSNTGAPLNAQAIKGTGTKSDTLNEKYSPVIGK